MEANPGWRTVPFVEGTLPAFSEDDSIDATRWIRAHDKEGVGDNEGKKLIILSGDAVTVLKRISSYLRNAFDDTNPRLLLLDHIEYTLLECALQCLVDSSFRLDTFIQYLKVEETGAVTRRRFLELSELFEFFGVKFSAETPYPPVPPKDYPQYASQARRSFAFSLKPMVMLDIEFQLKNSQGVSEIKIYFRKEGEELARFMKRSQQFVLLGISAVFGEEEPILPLEPVPEVAPPVEPVPEVAQPDEPVPEDDAQQDPKSPVEPPRKKPKLASHQLVRFRARLPPGCLLCQIFFMMKEKEHHYKPERPFRTRATPCCDDITIDAYAAWRTGQFLSGLYNDSDWHKRWEDCLVIKNTLWPVLKESIEINCGEPKMLEEAAEMVNVLAQRCVAPTTKMQQKMRITFRCINKPLNHVLEKFVDGMASLKIGPVFWCPWMDLKLHLTDPRQGAQLMKFASQMDPRKCDPVYGSLTLIEEIYFQSPNEDVDLAIPK